MTLGSHIDVQALCYKPIIFLPYNSTHIFFHPVYLDKMATGGTAAPRGCFTESGGGRYESAGKSLPVTKAIFYTIAAFLKPTAVQNEVVLKVMFSRPHRSIIA